MNPPDLRGASPSADGKGVRKRSRSKMKSAGLLQPRPNGEPFGKDCPPSGGRCGFPLPVFPIASLGLPLGRHQNSGRISERRSKQNAKALGSKQQLGGLGVRTKPKKRITLHQSTPSGPTRRLFAYRLPQMLKKSMKTAAATAFNPLSPLAHNRSRRCGSAAGLSQTAEPPIRRRFPAKRRSKSGMVCAYLRFTSRVFDIFPIHNFHFNNICKSY